MIDTINNIKSEKMAYSVSAFVFFYSLCQYKPPQTPICFTRINTFLLMEVRSSRHAIFREYLLSVTSALQCSGYLANIEHWENWTVLDEKVVFVLKVCDLVITNVDLVNHEAMFPEYSWNIPRMFVSKIFQAYPWNIVKWWKYF